MENRIINLQGKDGSNGNVIGIHGQPGGYGGHGGHFYGKGFLFKDLHNLMINTSGGNGGNGGNGIKGRDGRDGDLTKHERWEINSLWPQPGAYREKQRIFFDDKGTAGTCGGDGGQGGKKGNSGTVEIHGHT